jgi:gliding motility-associated lipoprotein GldD
MRILLNNSTIIKTILFIAFAFFVYSCGSDYTPRPRGYFRIDLPQKKYLTFDTTYPYTFEYPVYARVVPDTDKMAEPFWTNVDFPRFKGRINISYKKADRKNVYRFFEDSRTFVNKHIPKSDEITPEVIANKENHVYGLIYDIEGTGVASTYQFCLTDSTHHFIRGALYFNIVPNNDSLAPVIDFIKEDIRHLVKTLKWKTIK